MKKLIAIAAAVALFSISSQAQVDGRPLVISLSPEANIPIGTFKSTNKAGYGGNISVQFLLAEKLRLLTSVGGAGYPGKEYTDEWNSPQQYPFVAIGGVRGGLKFYLTEAVFAAGSIGLDFVTQTGESKTGFAYTPMLGVELGGVDLFARYNVTAIKGTGTTNIQRVGLGIGYRL